jgi:hypothetical protein
MQELVGAFRSRNLELLEENNKLRTELESTKQQLLTLQAVGMRSGAAPPTSAERDEFLESILRQMTAMTMQMPQKMLIMPAAASAASATSVTPLPATTTVQIAPVASGESDPKSRAAEFLKELQGIPSLPYAGATDVAVETLKSDAPMPCIYSQ